MSRLGLAVKLAVGDLRRSPVISALLVVVLAAVIGVAMISVLMRLHYPTASATVAAFAAVLALVVTRLALAVQDRRRARTGALLVLSGARRLDAALVRVSAVGLLLTPAVGLGLVVLSGARVLLEEPATAVLGGMYGPQGWVRSPAVGFGGVVFAVVVGALVAAVPVGSGRDDGLRPALAGRRPSRPVGPLHVLGALALVVAGLMAMTSILQGWQLLSVLLLSGAAYLAGSCLLQMCEVAGHRFGVGVQLAGRSLNRHRYRTAPLVALVGVGFGIAVVAATARSTAERHAADASEALVPYRRVLAPVDAVVLTRPWNADQGTVSPAILDRVVSQMPGAQPTTIPLVSGPGLRTTIQTWHPATGVVGSDPLPGLATPEVLAALGLTDHQADVDAGRALVLNPLAATSDSGGLHVGIDVDQTPVVLDAVDVSTGELVESLPAVLLPPAFVDRHRPTSESETVIVRSSGPIDAETRRRLEAVSADEVRRSISENSFLAIAPRPGSRLVFETDHTDPWPLVVTGAGGIVVGDGVLALGEATHADLSLPGWTPYHPDILAFPSFGPRMSQTAADIMLLLAVLLATVISLTAVGLGVSQRRPDDVLLALQGARPGLRRQILAIEAGTVTMIGAILGVVIGPLVFWAYSQSVQRASAYPRVPPVALPWVVPALLVVAVPLALSFLALVVTPPLREPDVHRLSDDG